MIIYSTSELAKEKNVTVTPVFKQCSRFYSAYPTAFTWPKILPKSPTRSWATWRARPLHGHAQKPAAIVRNVDSAMLCHAKRARPAYLSNLLAAQRYCEHKAHPAPSSCHSQLHTAMGGRVAFSSKLRRINNLCSSSRYSKHIVSGSVLSVPAAAILIWACPPRTSRPKTR